MRSQTRNGAALVTATVFLILLSSIAVVLTERTVSAMTMEQRRTEELTLVLAAESAANKAYVYLQDNSAGLLRTDLTHAEKVALGSAYPRDPNFAIIPAANLGMSEVNRVPITARWCYMGQRAVRSGNNATTGDWEITELAGYASGTSLTAAQTAAGFVVQDVFMVRAHAEVGSAADPNRWRQRQVDMLFTPTSSQVLTRALFSRLGYTIGGSATGDQWNSAGGTISYSAGTKTGNVSAGSNGNVAIAKSDSGFVGQSNLNLTMPVPAVNAAHSYNIPVGGGGPEILNNTCTLGTGTYRAKYIDITGSDLLTINGNVTIYVDGPVRLQTGNGNPPPVLQYNPALTASLTIVQADYDPNDPQWNTKETLFELNGNQTAGHLGNPQQFVVVSAFRGSGKLNGTADFGGVIYAPNMTLRMNGNFHYYGAILVNSFDGLINGNFHMHYDTSLTDMNLPVNVGFSVVGWYASNPVWGGGTIP